MCVHVYVHVYRSLADACVPISNDESPRLMTLGSEAMMRLWWEVEELDTPCREVSVLTGGREPPTDTYNTEEEVGTLNQSGGWFQKFFSKHELFSL